MYWRQYYLSWSCEDVTRLCAGSMNHLESESVEAVITDPPYLYLKHKLDVPFDEEVVFENWYRLLKNNSIIAFFGRGDAFYRPYRAQTCGT